jgi:S1-C subfamily serine protease
VQRLAAGSPAQKLGLIAGSSQARIGDAEFLVGGDVLLDVMGVNVADSDARPRIRAALEGAAVGRPLSAIVLRGGKKIELQWTPPAR